MFEVYGRYPFTKSMKKLCLKTTNNLVEFKDIIVGDFGWLGYK